MIFNSNTIELTVHPSCYLGRRLTLCYFIEIRPVSNSNIFRKKISNFFPDREWIERTIARNDKDGDGGISLEEFIEMNIRSRARNSAGNSSTGSGIVREASVSERAR